MVYGGVEDLWGSTTEYSCARIATIHTARKGSLDADGRSASRDTLRSTERTVIARAGTLDGEGGLRDGRGWDGCDLAGGRPGLETVFSFRGWEILLPTHPVRRENNHRDGHGESQSQRRGRGESYVPSLSDDRTGRGGRADCGGPPEARVLRHQHGAHRSRTSNSGKDNRQTDRQTSRDNHNHGCSCICLH